MAILSCHVSIKLPPKISDGQQNTIRWPSSTNRRSRAVLIWLRSLIGRSSHHEARKSSSLDDLFKAISKRQETRHLDLVNVHLLLHLLAKQLWRDLLP